MRKNLFLLSLLGFVSMNLGFALPQKFVSFSMGLTQPKGNLRLKDYYDTTSGYGMLGLSYSLRFDKIIHKAWGGYIAIQNASVTFNAEKYSNDIEKAMGYPWSWAEYELRNYNFKSFDCGLQYILNQEKKLQVSAYLGSGFTLNRNKSLDLTMKYYSDNIRVNEYSTHKLTANANFGVKICYALTDKLSAFFKMDYLTQMPKYKVVIDSYINGRYYDTTKDRHIQPSYFSTLTIGVRYGL
jgi:hypothetical protein